MDDILRRMGVIESWVGEMRADVGAIKGTLPHLATKAELRGVEGFLNARGETLDGSFTAEIRRADSVLKADLAHPGVSLKAEIEAVGTRIIRWMVGTCLTTTALIVMIVKVVR